MRVTVNRRSVLGGTAAAAIAFAFSPSRVFGQKSAGPGPVMNALSAYMSAAATRALPEDVTEHA
jgi:hypothetical protein